MQAMLYSMIIEFINNPEKRSEMGRAMASLAKPNAAEAIADVLIDAASHRI